MNRCVVVEESDTLSLLRTMQALKLRPSFTDRIEESLITHRLFIQDDMFSIAAGMTLDRRQDEGGEERENWQCDEVERRARREYG